MYNEFNSIHEKIMEDTYLKELYHSPNTNRNEAINSYYTKFIPKSRTYSTTNEHSARIYMAFGVQSMGHVDFYARFFENCV